MKKITLLIVSIFLFQSCIPLRVPPKIEDYKITKGAQFKRNLPDRQMFVFEDKKQANEFYNYIDIKYQLDTKNVADDVPFKINNAQYFFSFYEVDIPNKSLNLFPIVTDVFLNGALNNQNISNGTTSVSRNSNWYIAIEVYSDSENDCLQINSLSREPVLKYLRALKNEYLSTHNNNEALFKN